MEPTIQKNSSLILRNLSFTEAKPWCMQKRVFLKNETYFVGSFFGGVWSLKPYICIRFLIYFKSQKKTTFGARFGSFLDPVEPKILYFILFLKILQGFAFEPQKRENCSPTRQDWVKMASESPVMVPYSTDHTHPVAHTLKRFVYVKPPRN